MCYRGAGPRPPVLLNEIGGGAAIAAIFEKTVIVHDDGTLRTRHLTMDGVLRSGFGPPRRGRGGPGFIG